MTKILARDDSFVLVVDEIGDEEGFVFDTTSKTKSEKKLVSMFLRHGYWESVSEVEEKELLSRIQNDNS